MLYFYPIDFTILDDGFYFDGYPIRFKRFVLIACVKFIRLIMVLQIILLYNRFSTFVIPQIILLYVGIDL